MSRDPVPKKTNSNMLLCIKVVIPFSQWLKKVKHHNSIWLHLFSCLFWLVQSCSSESRCSMWVKWVKSSCSNVTASITRANTKEEATEKGRRNLQEMPECKMCFNNLVQILSPHLLPEQTQEEASGKRGIKWSRCLVMFWFRMC